jgi:1-deoxy-D-xylulose-5-phosphate reductoisomerase
MPTFAYEAMDKGGNMACILNAANEISVEAFLNDKIGFLQIAELNERCMNMVKFISKPSLEDYIATDSETRNVATAIVNGLL